MFKKIVLPLAIIAVALASFGLAYRAGHPFQTYLFHSDALYLPTVFADLFSKGGHFSDWYLTPAPYLFPDFALYLIAYLVGNGPFEQILLFALLQIALVTVALYFIVKASSERYHWATTSLIVVALIWLSVNASEPYVELVTSAYHFGAFLSSLAFVALWLHLQQHNENEAARSRILATMCLVAFATSLSDNIFLVQTIVPFVACSILLWWTMGTAILRRLIVPGAVLLASALGSFSYRFIVTYSTRYPTALGWAQLRSNIHDLVAILGKLFTAFPLLGLVFLAYLALGIACCVALVRKRTFFGMPSALNTLILFSMLSMAATVAAVLLVTNLPTSPRYLISVLIWPIVVVVLATQHLVGPKFFWPGTYAASLLALSLLAMSLRLPQPASSGYYPEEIACIDKALAGKSLHNGIAQYWDAKRTQMLSHQPLTLAQYVGDLTQQKWITSERYYRDTYDFAIIAEDGGSQYKLPVDMLTTINGKPAETASCGNRTVLIYGPDKLRIRKITSPGSSFAWRGCQLPMLVGKATSACEAEKADASQEGFVTFGPYEPLPAGEYAFDLTYVSSKPETETAGEWDAALSLPTEAKRLSAGELKGTGGQARTVSGNFSVEKQFDMTNIEIRTLSNKGGTLKVVSLRLSRTR
jgi:hypothetical protein